MKKRLVSILLALCMALSLLPVAAWAIEFTEDGFEGKSENIPSPENNMSTVDIMPLEDTLTYGNLTYKIENGEITITGCTSSSPKNVAIPAEIDGIPVTSIGNQAFFMKSVSNLTIPSSIISIGDNAFNMCFDLTSVTIPNSVTKIGDAAFASTHLTSVTIPSSVTSLGASVFNGCKELTNVTIPNSVTSISKYMFAQCSSLTSVTIPNSVTDIGKGTFSGCSSLTSITIPTSVTNIGEYAFECTGLTNMTIPNSVTNIGLEAFSGCTGLTDVSISNNISSIAEGMFSRCTGLTNVTIPKGITSIGDTAFSDCTSLTSVIIPDSVTSIGDYAFNQCFALEDVYFAGNAEQWKEIDISAATMKSYDGDGNLIGVSSNDPIFTATIHYNSTGPGESLDSKTISGVLRQGDGCRVLWQCSYQVGEDGQPQNANVKIFTSSTDTVPEELFLYNESAENGLPFPWELEPYSVPKSAVKSVSITGEPKKLLRVSPNAFQGYTGLEQVVLNCVSAVDTSAFAGCTSLQSMTVPSTLKYIGANAFQNTALGTITLGKEIETIDTNAFSDCANIKIRCYENSVVHQYAEKHSIPFELIDKEDTEYKVYCNNGYEGFKLSLEECMGLTKSAEYNPKLAHMLIAMCNSVHSNTDMVNTFDSFGFNKRERFPKPFLTYSIGAKQVNGKTIVLVVVRGTEGALEWVSNLDAGANEKHQHSGFSDAAGELYDSIVKFLGTNDFSNVQFVITGHSRGAAASNILAAQLVDEIGNTDNIYAYTFACPDTAVITDETANRYPCIYNINNINDPVSWIPGSIWTESGEKYGHGVNSYWSKYGKSYWYCKDEVWDDHRVILDSPSSIPELLGMADRFGTVHPQNLYLDYLKKELVLPSRAYKTRSEALNVINVAAEKRRQGVREENIKNIYGILTPESVTMLPEVSIFCPVDIEIYNSEGQLLGSIINNTINNATTNKIYISVFEDDKYIYMLDNDEYTIKLNGTDIGAMTYSVQNINARTGAVAEKQAFEQVVLTDGKRFESEVNVEGYIASDVSTKEVRLYVLGTDDTPEKKVLPDGKGTEVPLSVQLITFDASGGSVTTPTAQTGVLQKKLCKRRQAIVKETGANQGAAQTGHSPT